MQKGADQHPHLLRRGVPGDGPGARDIRYHDIT